MKCSSSKAKNQHLTFNLTPLKQNVLFDSSSALTIGILFYFIFLLIICTETFTRTFHYIMNSPKVFYLNLRMMAWSRRNVILLYCCFLFLRIPVALESHRSSQEGGGGGAYPLHLSPRSATDVTRQTNLASGRTISPGTILSTHQTRDQVAWRLLMTACRCFFR